jgi:hypothetical protein
VFSWIGRKISREFERFLERSFQKTADRLNKEHEIEYQRMYDSLKTDYINEIGADVPSKGTIVDKRI